MSNLILNYALDSANLANPDKSLPATAVGCSVVAGPGSTLIGNYSNALNFGTSGNFQVQLPVTRLNTKKFCVRTVVKIDTPVLSRQALLETNSMPFSISVDKAGGTNDFKVLVSVSPAASGASGTSTEFFMDMKLGTWYLVDLIYDTDTVAVAINGTVLSVHAFPVGKISLLKNATLFVGTTIKGNTNHFQGSMAALQLHDDIPIELETQLDEKRSTPEWYISYKYEQLKPSLNLGQPKSKFAYDYGATAYIQMYDYGLLMYHEGIGAAFELHGDIFNYYTTAPIKPSLGYLVSDEGNAGVSGSRKNIFSKGGLYWSSGTGVKPVTGQMYIDYELMGEAAFIGLPMAAATSIPGGDEQVFQGARMYYKYGATKAHEVNGLILSKFLATGGVQTWGFPTSNESDVRNNGAVIGKFSDFDNCTIYWSSASGAYEVHGDIRQKYRDIRGPISSLGFPTSDEQNIPGAGAPARCNTFQNGSILWFGSLSNMFVCNPFRVYLNRIDSIESEGLGMGQNDIYLFTILEDNHHEVFRKRFPDTGDFGDHNVIDVNQQVPFTIVPNDINRVIDFTVDVWDSDPSYDPTGDDHLGKYHKSLNIANGWGLRENQGIFNSGSFSSINAITWSVQPQVNEQSLSEVQKWWGVTNQGTATISHSQYAAAFRDVDSEPEWWDLTDWLEKAYYDLVVSGVAKGGNCFGMSLEGIYARKHRSLFSMPLDRFTTWSTVVNEFNIKHEYQVGAEAIWWFVGQFLSGNTHSPMDVFNETFNAMMCSDNPVVCITQNWDFSGAAHCLMPVAWDNSSNPWRMKICDPNFPGQVREILIDTVKNEYTYAGAGKNYKGGAWSGGRLHYMPYSVLNERPRTPIWDAIMLLLTGTIVFLGSDATTESFTDENGIDLDAFSADAIARMKQNKPLDNKFVSFKGFRTAGNTALASEMYMRIQPEPTFQYVNQVIADNRLARNITVVELAQQTKYATLLKPVIKETEIFNTIQHRNLGAVINDAQFAAKASPGIMQSMYNLAGKGTIGKNLMHKIKGKNDGKLNYIIKSSLNQMALTSPLKINESNTINASNLGTASTSVEFITSQNKLVKLEIENKLGVGNDKMKIVIDKIPADIARSLQLSIKPGMAGVDILTPGAGAMAEVSIQSTINKKVSKSNFAVNLDTGIRLRPSTVLSSNELKVSRIDNIFGQIVNSTMLKPKI